MNFSKKISFHGALILSALFFFSTSSRGATVDPDLDFVGKRQGLDITSLGGLKAYDEERNKLSEAALVNYHEYSDYDEGFGSPTTASSWTLGGGTLSKDFTEVRSNYTASRGVFIGYNDLDVPVQVQQFGGFSMNENIDPGIDTDAAEQACDRLYTNAEKDSDWKECLTIKGYPGCSAIAYVKGEKDYHAATLSQDGRRSRAQGLKFFWGDIVSRAADTHSSQCNNTFIVPPKTWWAIVTLRGKKPDTDSCGKNCEWAYYDQMPVVNRSEFNWHQPSCQAAKTGNMDEGAGCITDNLQSKLRITVTKVR